MEQGKIWSQRRQSRDERRKVRVEWVGELFFSFSKCWHRLGHRFSQKGEWHKKRKNTEWERKSAETVMDRLMFEEHDEILFALTPSLSLCFYPPSGLRRYPSEKIFPLEFKKINKKKKYFHPSPLIIKKSLKSFVFLISILYDPSYLQSKQVRPLLFLLFPLMYAIAFFIILKYLQKGFCPPSKRRTYKTYVKYNGIR